MKLIRKEKAMKKSVLQKIPQNWKTPKGQAMKMALENTISSIIESEDEGLNFGQESGINTLESGTGMWVCPLDQDNIDLDFLKIYREFRMRS